jgi:hypothetical protein
MSFTSFYRFKMSAAVKFMSLLSGVMPYYSVEVKSITTMSIEDTYS